MANLWSKLFSRSADPVLTMQDYADQLMSYQGNTYPIYGHASDGGSEIESSPNDFESYVAMAYKSNGAVFSVMLTRMLVFSEARFQYQRMTGGRPGDLFGTPDLAILENPWPNGTTGELLSRAIQEADLAGNHYAVREPNRIRRLRPDWTDIILTAPPEVAVQSDVAGYRYTPGGRNSGATPKFYLPEEMAHWSPIPDPTAMYRGMSWLTPIMREIQSDKAATHHKGMYFKNAATPNLAITLKDGVTPDQFKAFMEQMERGHAGVDNAYKTLYLGAGADVTVVGGDMKTMDFKAIQGAIETRIANAGRVHPVLIGMSEGLQGSSLNSGNFTTAKDWFGSATMRPLWRSISAAYQTLVPAQAGARLWYDDRDIPALRQDKKDAADIQTQKAATIQSLITAGFEPKSVVAAVNAEDFTLLVHSGLVSVQLLPPGQDGGADPNTVNSPPSAKPTPAIAPKPAPKPKPTAGQKTSGSGN